MKLKSSQMPSNSSPSPNKKPLSVVITPSVETSTSTLDTNLDESATPRDKYREHLMGSLDDILLEYITNDTEFTPYDFVSDLRTRLYSLQDYFQDHLNRTNAILAYLDGEQSIHLFDKRKK